MRAEGVQYFACDVTKQKEDTDVQENKERREKNENFLQPVKGIRRNLREHKQCFYPETVKSGWFSYQPKAAVTSADVQPQWKNGIVFEISCIPLCGRPVQTDICTQ